MGLFRSGIEKEFAHYRRQKTLSFMDEVPYTTAQLHQEKPAILDAAHKYRKRVLVHDVYSTNPGEPAFVATPDGQWLTIEEWIESQRRKLPTTRRTPAEIYRAAAEKNGPDILTRAGFDSTLDDTGMWEWLFEKAVERFDQRIAGDGELADEDVENALLVQAGVLVGTPQGEFPEAEDPIFHALHVAGRAGYVWRTIEHDPPKGLGQAHEELEQVYCGIAVHGGDRTSTLCVAAERALDDGAKFWWASPGAMLKGRNFLEAAYDYVLSDVLGYDGGDLAGEQALRRMFFLGVLMRDMETFTGPAPAAEDYAADAPVEQRLGRELFERDEDAYMKLAGWIVSDSVRPQLPEDLRRISTRVIYPLLSYFDRETKVGEITPLASALARFYGEITTGAYTLASREEWESFDAAEFGGLADEALARNGRTDDNEENAALIVGGVSGRLDDYAALSAYVDAQPANIRLGAFADRFAVSPGEALISLIDEDGSVKEKVRWTSTIGWATGVMLSLLERAELVNQKASA
jgi:hypothetical protein